MKEHCKARGNTIPPAYRELIVAVISAACEYYGITKDQLISERSLAHARQKCYYIIIKSTTGLYDYDIGNYFNKGRTSVQYGIALVDSHKVFYRQVLGDLNNIIALANNFDKKYSWDLPLINTTS